MDVRKLLLVEDDPDIQRVVVMALEFAGGWDVSVASNGREGLERAAALRPDVILLDAMMPVMDGMQMCHALKASPDLSEIPVVFLTARGQPEEVQAALDAGAVGYLVKPFDPMTLADELASIMEDR